tara:strand:+ start:249 stop:644 length:396 start_codon:yes stop_codon:yes gene_type:complete
MIGLWYDIDHIRIMESVFNTKKAKNYLIQEATRDFHNDKPIVIINEKTQKSSVVELNDSYTDFEQIQNKRLTRQMDRIWNKYLISKVKVQNSNLSVKDKSKYVDLAKTKYLNQIKLSDKSNTELENKLKKL